MPASEHEKIIELWEKGFYIEQEDKENLGTWTDVSSEGEPDWNFDDYNYRIKVHPMSCFGYFNIYTAKSGDENGATNHRVTGPFYSIEDAEDDAAANKGVRTARLVRSWSNGDMETD